MSNEDHVATMLYCAVVSFCAPIWEEIMFRGFLQQSLARYLPPPAAILVSSVVFAGAHISAHRVLPLMGLGIALGVLFNVTSRNLLPCMVLHRRARRGDAGRVGGACCCGLEVNDDDVCLLGIFGGSKRSSFEPASRPCCSESRVAVPPARVPLLQLLEPVCPFGPTATGLNKGSRGRATLDLGAESASRAWAAAAAPIARALSQRVHAFRIRFRISPAGKMFLRPGP